MLWERGLWKQNRVLMLCLDQTLVKFYPSLYVHVQVIERFWNTCSPKILPNIEMENYFIPV